MTKYKAHKQPHRDSFKRHPEQEANRSYGMYNHEPRYFAKPTPGTDNKESLAESVDIPDVTIKGGCYENALDIVLTCDAPDAVIRYTIDGTEPTLVNGVEFVYPGLIYDLY